MKDKPEARILVVEDELPMRVALQDCLEAAGYRVLTAENGEAGLDRALKQTPDLILLDVMMPRLDGFAVCEELRRLNKRAAVLFLTAKAQVQDKVAGFDAGADDYLAKPFSTEELLARVRALLRRVKNKESEIKRLKLGSCEFDFVTQQATRNGEPLRMTAKEMAMVRLLAEAEGEAITRERFLDVIWGYTAFPSTRTVDNHIASLRGKIEENSEEPKFILTVHGVGYRLENQKVAKA